MKKIFALFVVSVIVYGSTGCSKSKSEISGDMSTSGSITSSIGETSELNSTGSEQNINHNNPREYLSTEEAEEIINKSNNLKTSDNFFYALVPKSIDHVSEFYASYGVPLSRQEALDEFIYVFEYLFPEHELNKKCLYYRSYLPDDPEEPDVSYDDDGNLIKGENFYASIGLHPIYDEKYYDSYMDGTLGNEKKEGYFFYSEEKYPNENSVAMTMRSPFGNDLCMFNKGVAYKIVANRDGNDEYYAGENFIPDSFFEYIGNFSPDSEESFMLLDKEISIKDAVKFFEDYIASIPCASSNSAFGIHVNEVYVYKVDDKHYCYEFINSRIYDGIPFNYAYDGTKGDENRDLATATMIKSDDVDALYASYRASVVRQETPHTEIVPFEEAVKITSDKMTDYVDFQVERAELMYCSKGNISGSYLVGEDKFPVYPAWKFLLYNPNDDSYYAAFVNALTGEFSAEH